MEQLLKQNKVYLRVIIALSVAIPLVVAALLFMPFSLNLEGQEWVRSLPAFNAIVNSLTTLLLISALIAIKRKKWILHRNLMLSALMLGAVFLISYVTYHASFPSTIFGDLNHDGVLSESERLELGSWRSIYLFTLLSHIGCSIVVVPFVLIAFYRALTGQYEKHRKIVKYTFPIWLYVSITGVLVYLMISPYYF